LVQYAKANPGKLTSGATVGIGPHVCLELFRVRTASNIVSFHTKAPRPRLRICWAGRFRSA
ncbi:MAG TPA: hypothetical protein VFV12_02810, partial [Xanthobacteraceae bacterium]|nr:hypothetical protein [Xanthobacteraceae bacterium]